MPMFFVLEAANRTCLDQTEEQEAPHIRNMRPYFNNKVTNNTGITYRYVVVKTINSGSGIKLFSIKRSPKVSYNPKLKLIER